MMVHLDLDLFFSICYAGSWMSPVIRKFMFFHSRKLSFMINFYFLLFGYQCFSNFLLCLSMISSTFLPSFLSKFSFLLSYFKVKKLFLVCCFFFIPSCSCVIFSDDTDKSFLKVFFLQVASPTTSIFLGLILSCGSLCLCTPFLDRGLCSRATRLGIRGCFGGGFLVTPEKDLS